MNLSFKKLDLSHLNELIELSTKILNKMPRKEFWGGINDDEFKIMIKEPNYILGIFDDDKLIAFMSSYNPVIEDFFHYDMKNVNPSEYLFLHGAMVSDSYRGLGLQKKLGQIIIDNTNKKYILATVHPENLASKKSLLKLGLKVVKTMEVGYGYRDIMILEK